MVLDSLSSLTVSDALPVILCLEVCFFFLIRKYIDLGNKSVNTQLSSKVLCVLMFSKIVFFNVLTSGPALILDVL